MPDARTLTPRERRVNRRDRPAPRAIAIRW